jgi:hypothetical protein
MAGPRECAFDGAVCALHEFRSINRIPFTLLDLRSAVFKGNDSRQRRHNLLDHNSEGSTIDSSGV